MERLRAAIQEFAPHASLSSRPDKPDEATFVRIHFGKMILPDQDKAPNRASAFSSTF
jgi:hypothetical protein